MKSCYLVYLFPASEVFSFTRPSFLPPSLPPSGLCEDRVLVAAGHQSTGSVEKLSNQRHFVGLNSLVIKMAGLPLSDAGPFAFRWPPGTNWTAGCLRIDPYPLRLRSSFGTAHTQSLVRLNALVRLSVGLYSSCAEVGLPPKKPGCYEADYGDCARFFAALTRRLDAELRRDARPAQDGQEEGGAGPSSVDPPPNLALADPWAAFPEGLRVHVMGGCCPEAPASRTCRLLLSVLDACMAEAEARGEPSARPVASGVETAVLSCWAAQCRQPLHAFLGLPRPDAPARRSFYTAALDDDVANIVKAARFGAAHTPLLKIKLDGDMRRARVILDALAAALPPPAMGAGACLEGPPPGRDWAIDANSSWTPAIAMHFLREVQRARGFGNRFPSWPRLIPPPPHPSHASLPLIPYPLRSPARTSPASSCWSSPSPWI